MEEVSTIGLDLAKSVFQVHGIDAAGRVVVRRQLRRGEVLGFFARLRPCLVACATAHHWGRELIMSPAYVKPYVKRGKTEAAVAEAIAEAVTRPTMRFVAVKSMDQQAVLMLHKVRDLLVRQRTMLIKGEAPYVIASRCWISTRNGHLGHRRRRIHHAHETARQHLGREQLRADCEPPDVGEGRSTRRLHHRQHRSLTRLRRMLICSAPVLAGRARRTYAVPSTRGAPNGRDQLRPVRAPHWVGTAHID
jgi:hypothetical protein